MKKKNRQDGWGEIVKERERGRGDELKKITRQFFFLAGVESFGYTIHNLFCNLALYHKHSDHSAKRSLASFSLFLYHWNQLSFLSAFFTWKDILFLALFAVSRPC